MDRIIRKKTREVRIGGLKIGGENPIVIQSMTNTKTEDVAATLEQIQRLVGEGCEIIRCAVPTVRDAEALREIKNEIDVPLIADIHFDYKLALLALKNGVDKIRINPGNIGGGERVEAVINEAKERGAAIRIGVNSGSLEKDILAKYGHPASDALVESALRWIDFFMSLKFEDIVLSVKSSNVVTNYLAYKKLSEKTDFPLHIGVTEAGMFQEGLIKSAAGMGSLLLEGIGDTLRVSLTGDPVREIEAGKLLLQSLHIRKFHPEVISCPTCGRCGVDLESLVQEVYGKIKTISKPISIAIMGCAVNGPGEAKEADIGIAGGKNEGLIFRKGEIVRKVPYADLVSELCKMIAEL